MNRKYYYMANNNPRKLIAIYQFCDKIEKTIDRFGNDFNTFQNDSDFYDSLFMKMVQLSELTKTVDDEYKKQTANQVPWAGIDGALEHIRMGFMAPHHFSVLGIMDDDLLWQSAIKDVPRLKDFCDKELEKEGRPVKSWTIENEQ